LRYNAGMDENSIERAKRIDTVLGVAVASAIGFILNLLGNLYYGLFITESISWGQVNHMQVYGIVLALVGLAGFLKFFIDDYGNKLEVNRSLIARFARYFFYDYAPGKAIRIIGGGYLLFVLFGFLISFYVLVANAIGYPLATLAFILAALALYLYNRRRG
jgi:hypothetical protein